MMPGVTNWLSFWSFETRERGEEDPAPLLR